MMENMDEISYSTGILAKKLGISKWTLTSHLRKTGLIKQCFYNERGHCRIPYSVAVRMSSAESLAIPPPTPVTRRIIEVPRRKSKGKNASAPGKWNVNKFDTPSTQSQVRNSNQPDYRQIGKMLRQAGVTMADLIKYIEQQMQTEMQKISPSSGGRGVGPSLHQMEENNEQNAFAPGENNSAQRDENQTDEPKSSGSTSFDISNPSKE